jgi:hypothetical protein
MPVNNYPLAELSNPNNSDLVIFDNTYIFFIVIIGFFTIIIITLAITQYKKNRNNFDKEKPLFKTVCGGTLVGVYETIPNIKLLCFEKFIHIKGSMQNIKIDYEEIQNIEIIGHKNLFSKLHERLAPTFFGSIPGAILGIFTGVIFFHSWNKLYYQFGTFIGAISMNLIMGKINIYNSLKITYREGKEINIYPAKIQESFDFINSKLKNKK